VDRQVLRDRDGLPYVPGKTLTGILRDAAEWVASVRDRAEGGDEWKNARIALFGEQPETYEGGRNVAAAEAAIGIDNATFSKGIQKYLARRKDVLESLFVVRPGVKIDPATGRSSERFLFSTEEVRGGCSLFATLTLRRTRALSENAEMLKKAETLLQDAVNAVRRIGGGRRRGGGRCRLKLCNAIPTPQENPDQNADALRGHTVNPGDALELDFRLTTLQPVVINKVTLGNVVRSDVTLPGVVLLPWLTREVLGPLDQRCVQDAVMNGEFSVGSFLPEFDEHLAWPVPLSFASYKDSDGQVIVNRVVTAADPQRQTKDLRSGYVFFENADTLRYATSEKFLTLRTHNTVEDSVQRPTENVGGLFTYEAIREGMTFRGTVRISAAFWEKIREQLPPENWEKMRKGFTSIGQSRKDEYGKISLEYVGPSERHGETPELIECAGNRYLIVYMASDVLFRDDNHAYTAKPDDLRKGLEKVLGVTLEALIFDEEISPLGGDRGHSLRTGRRESWHTKWTLPRPSLVYLQAGSVCVFRVVEGVWDPEKAKKVQQEGFGGRRAEGYGRLLFNPGFLTNSELIIQQSQPEIQEPETTEPEATDPFLRLLQDESLKKRYTRLVRRQIYGKVPAEGGDGEFFGGLKWERGKMPSASQFGALREAATLIGDGENGLEAFYDGWLDPKFKSDTEIQQKSLKTWDKTWLDQIKRIVDGNIDVETFLEVPDEQRLVDSQRLFGEFRPFALRTFFDILCEAVFDWEQERKKHQAEEGEVAQP
jgi:CRISPR-associated protein Csx10